ITDASGSETRNYDAVGNLAQTTRTIDGFSYSVLHGYDAAKRLKWTTLPDGDTAGTPAAPITYDGAGRGVAIPGIVTSASYTAQGRPASITHANGVVTTRSYAATTARLTGVSTLSGSSVIQNLAYTYDADGKITNVTSNFSDEGWQYSYDGLHRLTSATDTST